ncbi:efflux RND transporter permease subunit [Nitrincola alkalisediminis]|uniref:efflux RND transporter permease subunit n=1 Tax=Nitrincola alkalisediminis TaxID=1366656 RepID=UPI0018746C90|nr:efflux RND transporter permease subunit [Nitrincola alkalisediminis]
MEQIIRAAIQRSRATLLLFIFILLGGVAAYQAIPKEANPDVVIPMMYVSMALEGISPDDSERLLVRPMEQELRALQGVRKMTSIASEGHASVMLEFDAGFDPHKALQDVRQKVDTARTKLPSEADEPRVHEINVALFPVISIALSGPLPEAQLIYLARQLKLAIEGIPEVLEVDIAGDRDDLLEIIVNPQVLDQYQIDYFQLFNLVSNNNRLVAAGSLDTGSGRMTLKVPGMIESLQDILSMPVKVEEDRVVTFSDIATLRRTFKDPTGFARINGQPGLVLEISKRSGANIIDTTAHIQSVIEEARMILPDDVDLRILMDQSIEVRDMLNDLLNNVMTAVVLVLILIIASMGFRSALMVGLTIPGAFLAGILLIWTLGYTLNIIVLFSLILVAGMLVDGAIVVSEQADRYLKEGQSPANAWLNSAHRMSWPIIASTATTLSVFVPLLFWPGVVGEFMKYLPATVILCLLASLVMALIFLPTMGAVMTRPIKTSSSDMALHNPMSRLYRCILGRLLKAPFLTLLGMMLVITLIFITYSRFNHGVEFFPDIEPDSLQLQIRARGDLSVYEKDILVKQVEDRLINLAEIDSIYARTFASASSQQGEDVIGVLQFKLIEWHQRRTSSHIIQSMRDLTSDLVGIELDFRKQDMGPGQGKPFQLEVSANDITLIHNALDTLRARMESIGGFIDIEDNRSLPGIEWRIEVDREAAARLGADVLSVGNAVQLVSHGLMLATYRPEDANDDVDIRVRLPLHWRSIDQLTRLTLNTLRGQVPISHFVQVVPMPKTGSLHRVNGQRTLTLQSDLAEGSRLDERLNELRPYLNELPDGVSINLAGEDADQQEAAIFLMSAFIIAIFLMAFILVIQFNSLFQTFLVLSAILLSTAGVLLGLLINGQSFGIVMVGMGIIALAGIVVNNNIILIDTFNRLRREGTDPYQAALETGCLRLRPVLLTSVTTVLGLMPMVLGVNVNLLEPSLGIGAPSAQWWMQLSSAIAGGLTFATLLTLLLTPCLLLLGCRIFKT